MIALVPVRDGVLPLGGEEAIAEAGGRVLLAGTGTETAADAIGTDVVELRRWEAPPFAARAWALALAPAVAGENVVVLPATPDGRDLAPRLAAALGWPLLAGALHVTRTHVALIRHGGLLLEDVAVHRPVVATLQPGVRGVEPGEPRSAEPAEVLALVAPATHDVEVVEVVPPDPTTMDLSEAKRIVAGGAGLRDGAAFAVLTEVAAALQASMGATRVPADAGWVPFERQIGTTGVTVDPDLYLAFGISGAVQHVTGLGHPEHVVSVNLDASCPMMMMADLAIVTDAPAMLAALARRLAVASARDEAASGGEPATVPRPDGPDPTDAPVAEVAHA